ncbi:2191_t:CDS:2 [Funneliformis mosseae]|uniref:2191_t:CDS:1 n=1 Tax=Funneliformis mosseae TaxID=27381 RepID=A0A9N9BER4_FUNMO|nr:2191_t:CDS:2 [Funneliformis mosseae]
MNNIRGCPIGSKAWPLTLPWKINYQKANGKRLPEPNPPDGIVREMAKLHAKHHPFSNVMDNTLLNVLKIKNDGYKPWDAHKNAYNLIERVATVNIFFKNKLLFVKQLIYGNETTNYTVTENALNLVNPIQRDTATRMIVLGVWSN